MDSSVSLASLVGLGEMLARASIEVTARDAAVVDVLCDAFPRGIDVHVTFLPGDEYGNVENVAARLRRAGFNPVPHLTARNFESRDALNDHLARLSDRAGVTRALVIAGDVDRPRGPFSESLQLLQTGFLRRHGIVSVLFAGHPEGHPAVTGAALDAALLSKIAFARAEGFEVQIVTQFAFEPEPILGWIARMRAMGIEVPVRIGVAGPASTPALIRFAARCGIGNSMRALRKQGTMIGKLISDTRPDGLLRALAAGWNAPGIAPVGGIHIYMFGGTVKTGKWLADLVRDLRGGSAPATSEQAHHGAAP